MRKYTQEEVEKELNKHGFTLLSEYRGLHDTIIVEQIETGYRANTTYKCFKTGSKPFLFSKHNDYQLYNMRKYISNIDKDIEVIDVESKTKHHKKINILKIKCKCGNIFERDWAHIINDCHGNTYLLCPKCSRKRQTEIGRKEKDKINRKRIEDKGFTIINKNEHIYAHKPIEVIQNSTGYRVFIDVAHVQKMKKPIIFSEYTNKTNLLYNVNKYAENNNLKTRAIGFTGNMRSTGNGTPQREIEFRCGCGEHYNTNVSHFIGGQILCPKCSKRISQNEEMVRSFLKQQKIKYKREYKFNNCCDLLPLPFDFYLVDYDSLIEVDGLQHDKPVKMYGGMTDEEALENFLYVQKHDNIKNKFCKDKNIPLLRIKEKDIKYNDNYKSLILNFIKTAKD